MNLNKNKEIGIVAKFGIISRIKKFVHRDTNIPSPPTAILITAGSEFPYEISEMCRKHQRQVEYHKAQALMYGLDNHRTN